MLSSSKKKFYFIRHGETDFNQQRRYAGLVDIPLNTKGVQQVKQSLNLFDNKNISIIYSSPLKRALQTAYIISEYLSVPILIVGGFKERDFGILQGKKKTYCTKKIFYKGQTKYIYERDVIRGFKNIKYKNNFLIVGHSGTFKAISKYLLGKNLFKNAKNASPICCLKDTKHKWKIKKIKQ